jgi:hypothetical protein
MPEAEQESPALPTLLVFSDDWGRHPSSCQHLIRELLPRFRVIWVNTIGTRKPRFNLSTLSRAWEKLSHWFSPKRSGDEPLPFTLQVVSPRMWPWFSHRWDRWLNRKLLVRQLESLLSPHQGFVVAITTLPITADLVGRLRVSRWIYYCVDDFGQWPGLDGTTLQTMERELVQKVDIIVAAGTELQSRIQAMQRQSFLLTHGVDLNLWHASSSERAECLDGLDRPLAVFWGLIDRRMDLEFIRAISSRMTSGTIVLVGPTADPDPSLAAIPRVVLRPAVPYSVLPAVAREAAVLIMPYADLPVTRAMQPLKLKEYLAAGRPVVVRNLPAVTEWMDCLDIAESPKEFADLVLSRLDGVIPPGQLHARSRLEQEGWAAKAEQFAEILTAEHERDASKGRIEACAI